jgi:hypothetical protein
MSVVDPKQKRLRFRGWTVCRCQMGSLKRAHHFGLNRSANFGEQLILQDSVTQSISSPVLSFAPAGAAALAAGDKLPLFGAAWGACWGAVWEAAWFVRGSGLGSPRLNQSPDDEHPARPRRSSNLPSCLILRLTSVGGALQVVSDVSMLAQYGREGHHRWVKFSARSGGFSSTDCCARTL